MAYAIMFNCYAEIWRALLVLRFTHHPHPPCAKWFYLSFVLVSSGIIYYYYISISEDNCWAIIVEQSELHLAFNPIHFWIIVIIGISGIKEPDQTLTRQKQEQNNITFILFQY